MGTVTKQTRAILSVDDIFKNEDVDFAEVEAWGGVVRLGTLDAGTMMDFIDQNEGPGKRTAGIRLLIRSLVDAEGNRIGKNEMLEGFKKKNARTMNRLVDEILKLNGVGKTAIDISSQVREAGTDPVKLAALVAELRRLADGVEAAGLDETKLKAAIETPTAPAKND